MAIQMQIQALLTTTGREMIREPNIGSNIKVAKLPVFSKEVVKIERFIIACRLYLRMKMRDAIVEEQI